ncbi:sulfotransferase domain-containing protein [uncultured Mailhella sp.]|uniref:sulfotransferase domain-containing protein n=1 Tax=uncultured Mailhella sp. TaxID=1981031 RepID=UPI002628B541|nr:sulfotransferase domain-containing protein [uncultured Mailhella sp.]
MALNFIYSVIDLDGETIRFMKDKRFPIVWNSSDETFNKCCFMKGNGLRRYFFYKFKNITQKEFDHYVKQFIEGFLSLFDSNEIFVSDQMFGNFSLEAINKYLTDNPIKQICTYRDPRDQYLSIMRCHVDDPQNINGFISRYTSVIKHLNNPYEHRLMVRFEDLVLKYDETTQKIMDFCGIDPANHVRPKAVFDPAISVVNIGAYKEFIDQEFMRQIEEQLGQYCYYPEKENLSEEAWNLLKSVQ